MKNSDLSINQNETDVVNELKYVYWWEITQSDILYKQERRLRALVILFGNSCYALFGLSIYLGFMGYNPLNILSLIGSVLCFFAYSRYRYYRLRHIHVHGYFNRKKSIFEH